MEDDDEGAVVRVVLEGDLEPKAQNNGLQRAGPFLNIIGHNRFMRICMFMHNRFIRICMFIG